MNIILELFCCFPDNIFKQHIGFFYQSFTRLLKLTSNSNIQNSMAIIFERVGTLYEIECAAPEWEVAPNSQSLDDLSKLEHPVQHLD